MYQSPGEMKSSEVELGCHSGMDGFAAELFLNSRFSDTVFVTLLRTAVKTTISEVHKLLNSHWRGPHLLDVGVLAVVGGLFGLCGSERVNELFISARPLRSPSLISPMVSVDVKHHERKKSTEPVWPSGKALGW